jgi:tripartite-type tricarboxylate transporter receptor subunit TctC
VWKYGTNFINVDALKATSAATPKADGGGGFREIYGFFRSSFGLNEIFNTRAFAVGPLSDVSLMVGADFNTDNSALHSAKKSIEAGVQFTLPMFYKGFVNLTPIYKEWQHDGYTSASHLNPSGDVDFDVTWGFEWSYFQPLGFLPRSIPLSYKFFGTIRGPKGSGVGCSAGVRAVGRGGGLRRSCGWRAIVRLRGARCGLGDILPRAMAQVLQEQTGQTFIIDNRPGATQAIGTRIASHAAPDGYTLLFGSVTNLALNPILKKDLPYDPLKDFAPIALSYVSPMYLVTRPGLMNSVQDLIALAKREPKKLTYASGGVGSSSHLAAELFNAMAGTSMTHVPYSGTGPAMRDTIAGIVDLTFSASGTSYASNGQVRALAVTGATRSQAAPNVPTLAESGLPGYDATIWFGFLAPAGTSMAIVDKLYAEMKKAVDSGALGEKLRAANDQVELVARPPQDFRAFIGSEIQRWRDVVKSAKLSPQ